MNTTATSPKPPPPASSPQDSSFEHLERASKILDDRLSRDELWLGVGDSLTCASILVAASTLFPLGLTLEESHEH